jgi:predicted small metal-binding protein
MVMMDIRSNSPYSLREAFPMAKQFGCGDVVQGCQFVLTAENEAEVMRQVAIHAASAHGITEVTPDLVAKVKAAIKDVPTR